MANELGIDIVRHMRNESFAVATADPSNLKTAADVDKIISPILYIFGFPGNILAVIVWLQPRMRHSSGTYLAALGFVDLLFMVIHVMFEINNVWGVKIFNTPGICELLPVIYMATQYLSPLLVLGFTVERFVGVQFPLKRQIYCTIARARMASCALALFALGIGSMQGYIYQYNAEYDYCGFRESAVTGGHSSLWSIWTWITEMLVFMCVPLLILMFNVLIIRQIRRLAEVEKSYSVKAQTTTFSLLVVSFYLIVTTFPVSIVYAIRYFIPADRTFAGVPQQKAKYMLAKTIIDEIGATHHACKFYIFLITEQAFRQELLRVVAKVLPIARDKRGYEQQTEVTAQTEWNETEMGEVGDPDETDM